MNSHPIVPGHSARVALALVLLLMGTGCDDDGCHDCGGTVVVAEECCGPVAGFAVDVFVLDGLTGQGVAGAEIELIVAAVPEQRFVGVADPDGFVRFGFEAPVDAVAVVHGCAGGYGCNGAEILLVPGGGPLTLFLEL